MNFENFVINSATIVTFICFFTGFEICYKIWKKKSTKDYSSLPFQFGFINTTLWLCYGVLANNDLIVKTNIVGFSIFLFYNLFYYYMCSHRRTVTKNYVSIIILLYLLWKVSHYFDEPIKIIGLLASSFNIAFFSSPLMQINVVLKTKNAESLPFLLIFVSFVSSCLWLYYGIIIDDLFVKIPNFIAIFILGFQLLLFFIYHKSSTNYKEYNKIRVDGI